MKLTTTGSLKFVKIHDDKSRRVSLLFCFCTVTPKEITFCGGRVIAISVHFFFPFCCNPARSQTLEVEYSHFHFTYQTVTFPYDFPHVNIARISSQTQCQLPAIDFHSFFFAYFLVLIPLCLTSGNSIKTIVNKKQKAKSTVNSHLQNLFSFMNKTQNPKAHVHSFQKVKNPFLRHLPGNLERKLILFRFKCVTPKGTCVQVLHDKKLGRDN